MRTLFTLIFVSLVLMSFSQGPVSLNLKFTDDLFFSKTPGSSNLAIKYTVRSKLETVLILATDNQNDKRILNNENYTGGRGRQSFVVVVPELYGYNDNGASVKFNFGKNSAENNLDDAEVIVFYANGNPSPRMTGKQKQINFKAGSGEILSVSGAGVSTTNPEGKRFLNVEASTEKTATIEIARESHRGNVVIGIFSQKSGNLIGLLNPKDPSDTRPTQSFTVDENVYVVPVIRPVFSTNNGIDTIVFAVGDPLVNATVEATEE